ncbi:MAG TPA: FAD:protein FMN transferase [Longimicrobiales bacterium]|nr:FAD:protein FMN transferase [Longimicrobiales bacterium]
MNKPETEQNSARTATPHGQPERSLPSRRAFISLGLGAFVVGGLPRIVRGVAESRGGPRVQRGLVRRTVPVMGTIAEVAVVHHDTRYAEGAIDAALKELYDVDRTMSRFRRDSDIGRANARAAAGPVPVCDATAAVLAASLRWADASNGAFDPCLGEAVQLWDVDDKSQPPATTAVHRLAGRAFYRDLGVDRHAGSPVVVFRNRDVALDLGGIAKGYAVDRAVAALRDWGITNAFVNAGGDLYAMGRSADGDPWEVGVRSPFDPTGIIATLHMSDRAVATSGDYEQYFTYHGRRYGHLLDPSTAAPRRTPFHSVSVAADRCIDADAGATAVFGQSATDAVDVLSRAAPGSEIVNSA